MRVPFPVSGILSNHQSAQFPAPINFRKGVSVNSSSLILVPQFQVNKAAIEILWYHSTL